jgi:hypothetical protein
MFDFTSARDIALKSGHELNVSAARELREGWFFPASGDGVGSSGVVVNRSSGRVFVLGSAFSVERDLRAYDEGFQFETCDLVVTAISNMNAAVEILGKIGPTIVEPEFAHGKVWRVPRQLGPDEIRARLGRLPCIFERTRLYFVIEHLQRARAESSFEFVLSPIPSREP